MTKLKTDDENRSEYLFLTLDSCINGFRSCCRPKIVIGGTYRKRKFRGVMFIIGTNDANEQIYPFGFNDEENDRSWT